MSKKRDSEHKEKPDIEVRKAAEAKPVYRNFPGPRGAATDCALRVAFDKEAFSEFNSHARESLDVEVCGILAGEICEDDEGPFVHVEAAIRGSAAAQKSVSVTFTHETWDAIYATLERDYPKLRIVGWYHTHPGFGVEFSSMDLFVHENFFPSPTQIALVTDPISGANAILINGGKGVEYLPKLWVDGREHRCQMPAALVETALAGGGVGAQSGGSANRAIEALETRVNQLVQSLDDQRAMFYRVLFFAGLMFCLGIIALVGNAIYGQFQQRLEPPKQLSYVPVPVKIGDHTAVIGVGIVEWSVPEEVDALIQKAAELKLEEEKKEKELRDKESKGEPKPETR